MANKSPAYPIDLAPEGDTKRQLIVTWQNIDTRAIEPIGLLTNAGDEFRFEYFESAKSVLGFRPFPGFKDFDHVYTAEELFPLFSSRVLSSTRPDYQEYVEKLDLQVSDATPWELLTRSEGKTAGDTIQLFPVPRRRGQELELDVLIAGSRHMTKKKVIPEGAAPVGNYPPEDFESLLSEISPGDQLSLVRETDNNAGRAYARLVLKDTVDPIGYLPDWIAKEFEQHIDKGEVSLTVTRVNPAQAGWHLRILGNLRVHTDASDLFRGEQWMSAYAA
ncbi:hypothetical protein F8O07_00645 [Pseudoclavibacter sp. CFCC 13796]|uniref:HIRAN domain-containing protein n=1 Tax=Pseudoclavibacter sp. CFCC 13796 TaxID=2615179 RepID=UPI0013016128|nr:HIRAN domain-containing protein [Pseudoclavibacter sp. CFCC 13796]KAB1660536.1 hypothetical protein F8O07_00645 [Pseudoclavibacter sp. CFCC 13796]